MRFIGTKIITAEPMTRAAYNLFRGWTLPPDENGADDGYLVEDLDGGKSNVPGRAGYVSWSPKEQFDNAYRLCTAMTFGLALEALKRGHRVARAGWNGSGQWVALGSGNPLLDASQFWNPHARAHAEQNGGGATVLPYFILKTAQGAILMGWSPSQSDALAEDWQIVDASQKPAPGAAHAGYSMMQPHQQRVVDEKADLDERLAKLVSAERDRLDQQAATMAMYSDILGDRIAAFAAAPAVGGQLIANGRNPYYEGQFEGETVEEAEARRAAAATDNAA